MPHRTPEHISIGFIGLGAMGAQMVRRLLANGHRVVVFDLRNEAVEAALQLGAVAALSARDVADQAEIAFVSLPDNVSCRNVVLGEDGIVHGRRVRACVNLGTVGSSLSREIFDGLAQHSILAADAPVTGGRRGAVDGTLTVMVSGAASLFTDIEPLLGCFSANIFYVGDAVGSAQTLKLANNLISLTAFVVTGEAMAMGVKAGLNPQLMLDAINVGTGRNTATSDKFPRHILSRNFDIGSTTAVAAKDVQLAVQEGETLGVPLGVGNAVRQFFMFALSQGDGPKDYTRIIQHLENWAGIEIAAGEPGSTTNRR